MEVYAGQPQEVIIGMPEGFSAATVRVVKDGLEVYYGSPKSIDPSSITVRLPYRSTRTDATISVFVEFYVDNYKENKTVTVDVVTPILDLREISSIMNPANPSGVSEEERDAMERRVRLAIQAYTGQVFGRYEGKVKVFGGNDGVLRLPRRLISIKGVRFGNVDYSAASYLVKGDGWVLSRAKSYPLSIKQAPPEEDLDHYGGYYAASGPIHRPDASFYNTFSKTTLYTVSGVFGYDSVPTDVQEAARILVKDYSCNESLYRERYIDNIRAADWRFEFNSAAFKGTGNVMADLLLSGYQRTQMVII